MAMLKRDIGTDVLLSLEYIKILYKSNEGLETVVHDLSKKNLGKVSRLFKKVIDLEKSGKPLRETLEQYSNKNIHPYIKKLLTALLSESKGYKLLSELSNDIVEDKKLDKEVISRRLDTLSNWLVIIPIAPILITAIDLLNQTLTAIPSEASLSFGRINDSVKPIILLATSAVLILLIIFLRMRKK